MKHRRIAAAAALALALVATLVVASSGPGAAVTRESARTVSYVVHFSPFHLLDLGAPGITEGDQVLFKDTLLDGKGRVVGHDGGFCVITKVEGATVEDQCLATYVLPGGQVTTQGLDSPAPRKPFAITGGTGRYAQARGDGVLVENGDGTGSLTFDIVTPGS
jgi:hypothetical protein